MGGPDWRTTESDCAKWKAAPQHPDGEGLPLDPFSVVEEATAEMAKQGLFPSLAEFREGRGWWDGEEPAPVAVEVLRVAPTDSEVLALAAEVERLRSANQANLGTAAAGWSAAAHLLDELGRRSEAYAARQTVQLLEKLAEVETMIGSPEWAAGKKRIGPLLRCGLYESKLCQVAAMFGGEVDCLACETLGGEP